MTRSDPASITSLVFAGGGNRCFWQLGFMSAVGDAVRPAHVAAVSAGSAMACAWASGRIEPTLNAMCAAYEANDRNFYWSRLAQGRYPFPQEPIYRASIDALLEDNALTTLQSGAELRIGVTRPPPMLGGLPGAVVGGVALALGDRLSPERPITEELGYVREWRSVRGCVSDAELADLIIASSCIPPLIHTTRYRGGAVLDGGFIRSVPVFGVPEGEGTTLVLLSQKDAAMPPPTAQMIYVGPSRKLDITVWDYTNPDAVSGTFALGQRDGERWLDSVS